MVFLFLPFIRLRCALFVCVLTLGDVFHSLVLLRRIPLTIFFPCIEYSLFLRFCRFTTCLNCATLAVDMKISLEWLGEYVALTTQDTEEIARRVTAHVAEVDEVEEQGKWLKHCCIGKVLTVEQHPNADRLKLCDVETDKGTKRVVCGGSNLREGMRVLFAHTGATVQWHGEETVTLEKTKIRGEVSEGMICAAEEVGLVEQFPSDDEKGILDFGDGDDGVGEDARTYLGLNGAVLHIDNHAITHRPDLFSHIGFAREFVAIGLAEWKNGMPEFPLPSSPEKNPPITMENKKPELMPRYCACVLEIDGLGETPDWMKQRLAATGWRSVNLPVDITNYVTMEIGLPLHSFDLDDLEGTVRLRESKAGETIMTLDNEERKLPDGALILEDEKGIFDLLGIMGGLRSSTKESTRRIYLHGASLDPVAVRRGIIGTGHRTEAATVYEKTVPPITTEQGFARALQLFLDLVPGARLSSAIENQGENGTPPEIPLSLERVNSVLGTELSAADVHTALSALGFSVEGKEDMMVRPPLWRLKDCTGSHDLIEEVGRIVGYDSIESVMPQTDMRLPARDHRSQRLRRSLKESGLYELVPLSLVGPDLLKKTGYDPEVALAIENALGEELSLMQPSHLPRLLDHAASSLRQTTGGLLGTFTIGRVFPGDDEHRSLGVLLTAKEHGSLKDDPFVHASERLRTALQAAGYVCTLEPLKNVPPQAHPGRAAEIVVDGTIVGSLFEVHPAVRVQFELPARASAVLLNLDVLFALPATTTVAEGLAQFPAVRYDETLTRRQDQSTATLLATAQSASDLLESVAVVDLYAGKPLEGSQYNLTLRFTYRSSEGTLTDEQAKEAHGKVMDEIGRL